MSRFPTTNWGAISVLRRADGEVARAVLADLCRLYWQPVYATLRRSGLKEDDARDATQSFFVYMLEKDGMAAADRERGRFRTFLHACLRNFLSHQREHQAAARSTPRAGIVSIDAEAAEEHYVREPAEALTPEQIYEREWARRSMERAMERLAWEQRGRDHGLPFDVLAGTLVGDAASVPYRELAEAHGTTEAAVKMTVKRLRHRFGRCLRAEMATLVASDEDVDDEARHVLRLFVDSGGSLSVPQGPEHGA